MLSLGILPQQKKSSLQAQEVEAHQVFLRVVDLMHSSRLVDQVEAVSLCGQICCRYASPVIVNSAFMRMAEAFRTGSSALQTEILRVIQRNAEVRELDTVKTCKDVSRVLFIVETFVAAPAKNSKLHGVYSTHLYGHL